MLANSATRTKSDQRERTSLTRLLAAGGVIGSILLVAGWTIAGLLRPGYSPIRQPISDLGIGANAWLIEVPGILYWLLLTGGVVAFFRRMQGRMNAPLKWTCAVLLGISPLGFGIASIFTEAPSTLTIHWVIGANLALIAPIVAFAVTGVALRRLGGLRRAGNLALVASGATFGLVAVTFWAFSPAAPIHVAGLMERVLVVDISCWYAVGALLILRLSGHPEAGADGARSSLRKR